MKSKQLKVRYLNRSSNNALTIYKEFNAPKIYLSGNFIREFGFNIGDTIQIDYEEGKLIIRPLLSEAAIVS